MVTAWAAPVADMPSPDTHQHTYTHAPALSADANVPQCLLDMVSPGANLTSINGAASANTTTATNSSAAVSSSAVGNATAASPAGNTTDPKIAASDGPIDTPVGETAPFLFVPFSSLGLT